MFINLFNRYQNHDRIVAALGPHAPYTCSDETLLQVASISERFRAPIHTHVSETRGEVEDSLKRFGVTPVERLIGLGILKPGTMAAHCVHFDDKDAHLFQQSGAAAIYNPDSNLKLSSGIAPIHLYRKLGIPVALGTDGAASNNDLSIFGVMDLGTKLQKLIAGDNTAMTASDALNCATYEGARALGLGEKAGSLGVGKAADLVVIDLQWPNLKPLHDLRSHLVYSFHGHEIESVYCAGKPLMRNRKILTLNESDIFARAEVWRERIQNEIATL